MQTELTILEEVLSDNSLELLKGNNLDSIIIDGCINISADVIDINNLKHVFVSSKDRNYICKYIKKNEFIALSFLPAYTGLELFLGNNVQTLCNDFDTKFHNAIPAMPVKPTIIVLNFKNKNFAPLNNIKECSPNQHYSFDKYSFKAYDNFLLSFEANNE